MAAITDPRAVKFCNEKVRILADLIEKTRRTAEQFAIDVVTEFEAHTGGNVNGDAVSDGAPGDGRSVITKQSVAEIKYVAEQLVACLNQDDRESIVAAVSVNGQPAF